MAHDDLTFKVERWDDSGQQIEALLALAAGIVIGRGAFRAAAELFPNAFITLRQGIRVIETTEKRGAVTLR